MRKFRAILRLMMLAGDFFVEGVRLILASGKNPAKIGRIIAGHRAWRHKHGLRRHDELYIPLDGGASRICRLCGQTVPADWWEGHLGDHHLTSATALSGR